MEGVDIGRQVENSSAQVLRVVLGNHIRDPGYHGRAED